MVATCTSRRTRSAAIHQRCAALLLHALIAACSPPAHADPEPIEAPTTATHPYARHALPQQSRHWIAGRIEERVLAGNYVYLRLLEPSGRESWLVSLHATTPTAPTVRALVIGRATHFHSRRLQRDFSPLLFAAVRSAAD